MGLTGAVLNEGGFKRHLISIENIGAGGLLFRSDIPHFQREQLQLFLQLEKKKYTLHAEVRHMKETHLGCLIGVKFVSPDPAFIEHVERLSSTGKANGRLWCGA